MYYDEQYINGNLHFRTTPNGEWKPFTIEKLNARILEQNDTINDLRYELRELKERESLRDI